MFDYYHNQIALAQSVYGVAESNVVELSASATGIPILSGAVASSTSTPGGGSTNGGETSGSSKISSGISGGTIAGIVFGVLIAHSAIGFVALLWFRRRRATRREPETEDREDQKKGLVSQDNKQELPDVQIAEPDTDEAINRDFITEKIELPTPDNKPELPENEVQIRATDHPREPDAQVQHNELELLGSRK